MNDRLVAATELVSALGLTYIPLPEKTFRLWEMSHGDVYLVTLEWVEDVEDPDECVTPGCRIPTKLLHDPFAGSYMATRVVNADTLEINDELIYEADEAFGLDPTTLRHQFDCTDQQAVAQRLESDSGCDTCFGEDEADEDSD